MKRDPASLAGPEFDVLVIGAGIYGSTLAWSAARRGLSVALVEAGDFGGAASANSLKIIHGGLRYLQHGNLRRMRESIRARRRYLFLAPRTVRPLACVMPTRGNGTRSHAVMTLALALNAWISRDRNDGLEPAAQLPAGDMLSAGEVADLFPNAHVKGATGAMRWHDAIAENTDRLNLAFVRDAVAHGAAACNYAPARKLIEENGALLGAEIEDRLGSGSFRVRAKITVCAAGPGNESLWPAGPRSRWVKASNLILRKPLVKDHALAIESTRDFKDSDALIRRGRRNFFVVPWRGGTMIGTAYTPYRPGDPVSLSPAEVEDFIRDINEIGTFPPIAREDVARVHAGILPAGGHESEPAKETLLVEAHTCGGPRGLIALRGVKYTTALETADQVADHLAKTLGRPARRPPDEPLPWCEAGSSPVDIERAVREEMAVTLSDLVLRRTPTGDFGLPPAHELESIAAIMAGLLGWDARRREEELREIARA